MLLDCFAFLCNLIPLLLNVKYMAKQGHSTKWNNKLLSELKIGCGRNSSMQEHSVVMVRGGIPFYIYKELPQKSSLKLVNPIFSFCNMLLFHFF